MVDTMLSYGGTAVGVACETDRQTDGRADGRAAAAAVNQREYKASAVISSPAAGLRARRQLPPHLRRITPAEMISASRRMSK